jgi:hypothetical protein
MRKVRAIDLIDSVSKGLDGNQKTALSGDDTTQFNRQVGSPRQDASKALTKQVHTNVHWRRNLPFLSSLHHGERGQERGQVVRR